MVNYLLVMKPNQGQLLNRILRDNILVWLHQVKLAAPVGIRVVSELGLNRLGHELLVVQGLMVEASHRDIGSLLQVWKIGFLELRPLIN